MSKQELIINILADTEAYLKVQYVQQEGIDIRVADFIMALASGTKYESDAKEFIKLVNLSHED